MAPKVPKKQSINANNDTTLKPHTEMKARFEKEMTEKLAPFIQSAKKAQEFVERMKEASKPKTYLMVAPPRPLTRRDLEEALASKKQKKSSKGPIALVFARKMSILFKKSEPDKTYPVTGAPLCKEVLVAIRPEFTATIDLAKQLKTTVRSIQSTVSKINRMAIQHLSLKEKIIIGEGIAGYRLNPAYSLMRK